MQIVCPVCRAECCTCRGCSPKMASNGTWVCPRCIESYERGLGVQSVVKSDIVQHQNASPWRQQIITNHLRKR